MVIVPFLIFSTIFGIHSGAVLNWKRGGKAVLNWKRGGRTVMNWKRGGRTLMNWKRGGGVVMNWKRKYIFKINCIMRESLLYEREINLIKYLK